MSENESLVHVQNVKKIDIEFENLSYAVPNGKKGKKDILKGISGSFKSGELTAIMGPSGAGKTTLLNILTGFQCTGMEGIVKCNGQNRSKKGSGEYKKDSCYILQDDQLIPLFTVGEIMRISADLKLSKDVSIEAKETVIDSVLEELGLSNSKQTRCGSLSGGQKKRLSIALELIDNPPIMFLDEPTTGLDSSASLQCITMLKTLAAEGRTIICTIHQPSATMYELFDHVYVLAQGHCVYQGDSLNTVTYLSSEGLSCPQYHNPADFLLEVANCEHGNHLENLKKAAASNAWRRNTKKIKQFDSKLSSISSNCSSSSRISSSSPSETSRFFILLKRTCVQLFRDWTITHLKLFAHILVGIVLGLLYRNFGYDGSKTIRNLGFFMISLVYLCYTSMMPAVLKFPSELAVLRKEQFNNWYKLKTYYAAYMVANIPIQVVFAFAYTSVSYILSSQPMEYSRFFMFLAITVITTLSAESVGIVLGTTVDPINGTFLGAISLAIMLSVSGFLIFYSHMPGPMYFLSYFSYLAYGFEGMVQAIYDNRPPLECPKDIIYCHHRFPENLFKEIGVSTGNFWLDLSVMTVNFIGFKILGFITLKKKLGTN